MSDITLEAFHLYKPFAGQYEGTTPSDPAIIERARKQALTLWGERPTLVQPPRFHPVHTAALAWLHGPALDEEDDGSQLVVIWFPFLFPCDARAAAMVAVDADGGWGKHAKGYGL